MKKPLYLFFGFLAASLIISCSDSVFREPSCKGSASNYSLETTIKSVRLDLGVYEDFRFESKPTDSTFQKTVISLAVSQINVDTIRDKKTSYHFSLIPTAFASVGPPKPEPTQKVENIIITSDKDIFTGQKTYKKGTNLKELFQVYHWDVEKGTVDNFIAKHKKFGLLNKRLTFQLTNAPDKPILNHIITVKLMLSGGKTHKDTISLNIKGLKS